MIDAEWAKSFLAGAIEGSRANVARIEEALEKEQENLARERRTLATYEWIQVRILDDETRALVKSHSMFLAGDNIELSPIDESARIGDHVVCPKPDWYLRTHHKVRANTTIGVIVGHSRNELADDGLLVDWGSGRAAVRCDREELRYAVPGTNSEREVQHD